MLQCPACHRFSIGYDKKGREACIYKNCKWVNDEDINVEKVKHPKKVRKNK
jgi:hypothetical protein